MTVLGLILIVLGWLIQLASKGKEVKVGFVLTYAVGVALLAFDGFRTGLADLAALNSISFIAAMAVLYKTRR